MNYSGAAGSASREWLMIGVLAAVQFVHILDFVLVMPLGPQLMRAFGASAREFGWIVSSYTFAAAVSGLIAAFFLDRFDRRNVLLTLLIGFTVGTGLCAISLTYSALIAARIFAGAFGGVLAAVVFAIVADQIPASRRGTAMGVVMSGFSVATVLGLPFGFGLANRFSWHAPFVMLAALSTGVLLLARVALPPMRGHIAARRPCSPLVEMRSVLQRPTHLRALALTVVMMFAGFSVIPFTSPFLVGNVGVRERDLVYIYLVGGAFTLFTGPLAGRLADRFGTLRVFSGAALISVLPILVLTHLPPVRLTTVLVASTVFMIFVSARMVVATTMITNSVEPRQRGSFMAVNSSVQQMAAGLASASAGLLISDAGGGRLYGYGGVGMLAAVTTLAAMLVARRLRPVEMGAAAPVLGAPPRLGEVAP